MELSFSPDQQAIRDAVLKLCERFDDHYRLERNHDGEWPHAFHMMN